MENFLVACSSVETQILNIETDCLLDLKQFNAAFQKSDQLLKLD